MAPSDFSLKNPNLILPTLFVSPMWAFLSVDRYLVLRQLTRNSEFFLRIVWESLGTVSLILSEKVLLKEVSGCMLSYFLSVYSWNMVFLYWDATLLGEKAGRFFKDWLCFTSVYLLSICWPNFMLVMLGFVWCSYTFSSYFSVNFGIEELFFMLGGWITDLLFLMVNFLKETPLSCSTFSCI